MRKLVAMTSVVALLAVAATALAAVTQHATGTFKGTTSQRLAMRLDVRAEAVRGGRLDVDVTCVKAGRRHLFRDSAFVAGPIPVNENGTFGAVQRARNSNFELRIAGQVVNRRASGRYREQFTNRFGTCRSGRVFWRLTRR